MIVRVSVLYRVEANHALSEEVLELAEDVGDLRAVEDCADAARPAP